MKFYLGSVFEAFAAIMIIFFIMACSAFGVFVFLSSQEISTFFLLVMCLLTSICFVFCIKHYAKKLYAWASFDNEKVQVKGLFFKPYSLEYEKLSCVEIAGYAYGMMKSPQSPMQGFICLSYDKFDSKYRNRVNQWEINDRRVKLQYSPKLCQFLLQVLPQRQANMLSKSLEKSGL